LVSNFVLGNNQKIDFHDEKVVFKHVATPVNVFFDGQKKEFTTEKATIEEALNEQKIKLDPFDITQPSRQTILTGQKIDVFVKRARPFLIIDNGQEKKIKSAYDNLNDIFKQAGIKIHPEDEVIIANPLNNIKIIPKIIINRLNPVTIEVDGQKISCWTKADKVKDLLKERGINLSSRDLVEPSLETYLSRNMLIKIIRVSDNTISEVVDIPYEIEYIYDNNLPETEEQIVQAGICGQKEQLVNIILHNGYLCEKTVIYERIISLPQKAIIKKGTRQAYSGYATWYGPGFEGSHTASGELFNPCALTAAHRTLPFGTLVKVTNIHTGLSCIVRINDRGPYSYHIIDLTRTAADAIGMSSVAPVILEVL